jgi:hypothetical protein
MYVTQRSVCRLGPAPDHRFLNTILIYPLDPKAPRIGELRVGSWPLHVKEVDFFC